MRAVYDDGYESCDSNHIVATLSSDDNAKLEKAHGFISPATGTSPQSPVRRAVANFATATLAVSLGATVQEDSVTLSSPKTPQSQPSPPSQPSPQAPSPTSQPPPQAPSQPPPHHDAAVTDIYPARGESNTNIGHTDSSRSLPNLSSARVILYHSSLYNSTDQC